MFQSSNQLFEKRRLIPALKIVWTDLDRLSLDLIAAGIGFFAMLAVFPALAVIVMMWSVLAEPAEIGALLDVAKGVMPPEVHKILSDQIAGLISTGSGSTIGWASLISLALALWSARAGVSALTRGLNSVYGTTHRVGFVRRSLAALGLTLILCGLSILAIAAVVVAPIAIALLPLGLFATVLAEVLRWLVALAVIVFALGLIYRYGPNLPGHRPGWITPGAVIAALLWLAVSLAFSAYLANFADYNEVYGSIGAAVALLMWFYLSAYVVLIGGLLNAALDSTVRDSRHADRYPGTALPVIARTGR